MLCSDLSVRSGDWIWHFKRSEVCRQGLTILNETQPALSDTVRKGGRSPGKSESCDTQRISTQRRPAVLSGNCRLTGKPRTKSWFVSRRFTNRLLGRPFGNQTLRDNSRSRHDSLSRD